MGLMTHLSLWTYVFLLWLVLLLVFAPHVVWLRRKGKTWHEIAGGGSGVLRRKHFVSGALVVLIVGAALVGLFVLWVHWKYPLP